MELKKLLQESMAREEECSLEWEDLRNKLIDPPVSAPVRRPFWLTAAAGTAAAVVMIMVVTAGMNRLATPVHSVRIDNQRMVRSVTPSPSPRPTVAPETLSPAVTPVQPHRMPARRSYVALNRHPGWPAVQKKQWHALARVAILPADNSTHKPVERSYEKRSVKEPAVSGIKASAKEPDTDAVNVAVVGAEEHIIDVVDTGSENDGAEFCVIDQIEANDEGTAARL